MNARHLIVLLSISISAYGQSDSLPSSAQKVIEHETKKQLFIGFNVLQLATLDAELMAICRINNRHAVILSAGYDFNALDFGNRLDVEEQFQESSQEAQNNPISRYFWGRGPAFRIFYDFKPSRKEFSGNYISLYGILKIRNYTTHGYGDGEYVHSESADQQVTGGGINYVHRKEKKQFMLRFNVGLGIRALHSSITWPAYRLGSNVKKPESHFTHSQIYPWFDLGFSFLFRVDK